MKHPYKNYHEEVRDKRYKFHPTENIILKEREEPNSLRTQYQIQNNTKIKKNQKDIKNENDELLIKHNPKKQTFIILKPKFNLPNCPYCNRMNWLDFN